MGGLLWRTWGHRQTHPRPLVEVRATLTSLSVLPLLCKTRSHFMEEETEAP